MIFAAVKITMLKRFNIMKDTTILIVEDEKEIADLIKLYLTNEGYETYSYTNGQEALNALEIHPFSLAILDIMLPDMNGL